MANFKRTKEGRLLRNQPYQTETVLFFGRREKFPLPKKSVYTLRSGYEHEIRPWRFTKSIYCPYAVVIVERPRYVLAERSHVNANGRRTHKTGEGTVTGALDLETGLIIRIVSPGKRNLVIRRAAGDSDSCPGQIARSRRRF